MNIELVAQRAEARCYCKKSNLANLLQNLVLYVQFKNLVLYPEQYKFCTLQYGTNLRVNMKCIVQGLSVINFLIELGAFNLKMDIEAFFSSSLLL